MIAPISLRAIFACTSVTGPPPLMKLNASMSNMQQRSVEDHFTRRVQGRNTGECKIRGVGMS